MQWFHDVLCSSSSVLLGTKEDNRIPTRFSYWLATILQETNRNFSHFHTTFLQETQSGHIVSPLYSSSKLGEAKVLVTGWWPLISRGLIIQVKFTSWATTPSCLISQPPLFHIKHFCKYGSHFVIWDLREVLILNKLKITTLEYPNRCSFPFFLGFHPVL